MGSGISPQAFIAGLLIDAIIVAAVLRIAYVLIEISLYSLLFQLSLVSPPKPRFLAFAVLMR